MNKKLIAGMVAFGLALGNTASAAEPVTNYFMIPVESDFVDVKAGDWYFGAAKYAKANGIFNGNDKGEFNPKGKITRAEMSQILYNVKSKESINKDEKYISGDKWYSNAMNYALQSGITSNKIKATDFGAGSELTRAEVFDMMFEFGKVEEFASNKNLDYSVLNTFADSNKITSESKDAIAWLVKNKILNGQDNGGKLYMSPSSSITRAEVATIMQNLNEFTSKAKASKDGKNMRLVVKANPTTGYVWNVYDYDKALIKIESTYESNDKTGTLMGAGGHTTFVISGLKEGTTTANFKYMRSWEGQGSAIDTLTYEITVDKNKNVSYVRK